MTAGSKDNKRPRTDERRPDGLAKNPPDDEVVIPVCLGEFGLDQAGKLRRLWESTWSQDKREPHKKR